MMEYDPAYADVIIDRYIKFTGDMPCRVNKDGTFTDWDEIGE